MTDLAPLSTLYDAASGDEVPLPIELAALYGSLRFPASATRPYVIGNFVTTLDGVVSLNVPGQAGGGEISGFNQHDRMVMGLLRAVADAVIVGAGTLRASPQHLWIAETTYRPLAEVYRMLHSDLGKTEPPLNVIVTAHGDLDLRLPVFHTESIPVLIVTTSDGARHLRKQSLPNRLQVAIVEGAEQVSARSILAAVARARRCEVILTEGGPRLIGDFFAEKCLDELFLTLAPQIAGRDDLIERPGLVAGKTFAPDHALWGKLASIKRGGDHLFLRYTFESTS
ncbi:MAG TPA: dihydrofolate reductase family protein [Anaerolineae bacterium]|nr:dihydrofolate reductase family protein [Anaerolineae bacterium]